jgi:hypothetical protein
VVSYDPADTKPSTNTDRDLNEIHIDALVKYGNIQSALRDERMQCLQDRRFVNIAGAQWEGPLSEQFENKPKLEVNKTAKSVDGIIREYRNNRMDVKFISKDGATDDELADTCAKLYRADEQDSSAEDAMDNAFQESVDGGIGAWRLSTQYQDEEAVETEDEPQRIIMEPIVDADSSVFFDLDCKRQDKSDAKYCYVVTSQTYDEYEADYGKSPADWPKQIQQRYFDWLTPSVVYVAEYYKVEYVPSFVNFYTGLDGSEESHSEAELENDDSLARTLKATGFKKTGSKKIKRKRIHKYILSGAAVLEDCGYIVGSEIPVVITYGKRVFIDNVERVQGHVRGAKDSQRILNMQVSSLAELSVMSPISKPIVTPEMIKGFQEMWAEDNIVNRPYLVLNPGTDAGGNPLPPGPLGYTKTPNIPEATAALIEFSNQNIKDVMGNPDEAGKVISHVTGQMVQAAQQVIDSNAYIYISNMAKAIKRGGQIWLSMAKELYTQKGRKMKGVGERGEISQLELQKPVISYEGKVIKANDLTRASFDVAVEVGPSSDSKREASLTAIVGMLPNVQDPETQSVLVTYALSQLQGEGVGDIREYARMKLLKQGVGKATPEEAKQLQAQAQNAKPSPNDQYAMAEAQKAQAEAQVKQADIALIAARTEKTKVDSIVAMAGVAADKKKAALDEVKTLSDIHLDHKQSAVDTAESLHGMLTQPDQNSSPGAGQ